MLVVSNFRGAADIHNRRIFSMKHLGLFAAGVLFGTAGLEDPQQQGSQKGLRAHHRRRAARQGLRHAGRHHRPRGRGRRLRRRQGHQRPPRSCRGRAPRPSRDRFRRRRVNLKHRHGRAARAALLCFSEVHITYEMQHSA